MQAKYPGVWLIWLVGLHAVSGQVVSVGWGHARLKPLPLGAARWTEGFWAHRFDVCRTSTIPALDSVLSGTNYSQFWRNFEILDGRVQGRRRGAAFNDGECYKWLEAAVTCLAVRPDEELARRIEDRIALIQRVQQPDGYLHTGLMWRARHGETNAVPFRDRFQFELYNLGHLFSAAAVHFRVTGQTSLLAVAERAASCLRSALTNPYPEALIRPVCPSHFMGLVDLYRATGESGWLDLARAFWRVRSEVVGGGDDNQDRLPYREHVEAVGHAVRANYFYAGATDLYLETGEPDLWQPLMRVWSNVVETKLFITGGCGALYDGASPYGSSDQESITRVHQAYGRPYQLPQMTAHCETCANIGWALWNWRMLLATGEVRHADALEQVLYNGVLSGMSLDGTNFFYTNPLRVTEPMPLELRWPRRRAPFISSFCCPPNLARVVAGLPSWMAAVSGRSVWMVLYGSGIVCVRTPELGEVVLRQQTEYPWSGQVRVVVEQAPRETMTLCMRVPSWAASAGVRVNLGPWQRAIGPGRWLTLQRLWQAGDIVDLELLMEPTWWESHPWVEESFHQVALQRGPLVYCLESADLPRGMSPLDVAVRPGTTLRARWDGRLLGGVVVLEGPAYGRPSGDWQRRLYRPWTDASWEELAVRWIPYCVWGNREVGDMSVWLRVKIK
ncbi:MAG: glycoside hydrolase family 127 protein [Verrucomicrobiota bacterium]|nr:glycoside hydrolase family 127 protein [Limisphaera sp.]MDW8381865.1 glycoside hydrolase family 127 protein [Verrucomicrobiota bacterium]